jgi:uncharacterized protein (DUF1800 family)
MTSRHAFHAAARFGLGARGDELRRIGSDPRGWLLGQLAGPKTPPEVLRVHTALSADTKTDPSKPPVNAMIQLGREVYRQEAADRMLAHIRSDQPFIERLVMFWSNHFTVSIQKPVVAAYVHRYEVDAIRPHVTGYFRDMLLAAIRHPAMLAYLDNVRSVGENSVRGMRRDLGLNENLAREILELHTLGVGGGYTQADVIALAKIITGWTFDRRITVARARFMFDEARHEPGAKTLLGRKFADAGEREGIDALTMLATHPSTAKHVATKLVRHFIGDVPPPDAVMAITKVFLDTGGHLPSVMKALLMLDGAWTAPLTKIKSPYEFLVSAFRLLKREPDTEQALGSMKALNYISFGAPSPAGFDDTAEAWMSADALIKRVEWAQRFAAMLPRDIRPLELAERAFGDGLTPATKKAIEQAASGADGLVLLFASPEFQRR